MPKYVNLFLVINLGCEMLYIIQQRLQAQQIATHKGVQVLTDLSTVLLNETLLQELSSPQTVANHEYVRTLLEDIVSVSVMQLDSYSMKKLWDLMTMVFKWQTTLAEEGGLLNLTNRHLYGVSKLPQLKQSKDAQEHVTKATQLFEKINEELTTQDLVLIRNALLFWLKDFRTNVSLLLRLGFQRKDGSFILNKVDENNLKNLGQNIYSKDYETSASSECVETSSPDDDFQVQELPFVINFTGNDGASTKIDKKIKFCFFDHQCDETLCVNGEKQIESSISYFQSQSKEIKREYPEINAEISPQYLSSLHEDLIKMLDVEE